MYMSESMVVEDLRASISLLLGRRRRVDLWGTCCPVDSQLSDGGRVSIWKYKSIGGSDKAKNQFT